MKRYKSILLFNLMIFINTIFLGCSNNVVNNDEEIKIGITIYKENDKFISAILENIENISKEKEEQTNEKISLDIKYANGSLINQSNQIDKFIEQNYDVICINIVDRTAAATLIDKAKSADIPIVFFNREPVEEDMYMWDKLYYVGANAQQAGELQGDIVVDLFNENKEQIDKNNDDKIQYVILEGEYGHQDTAIRTEYCIKSITDNEIEVEKLDNASGDWEFIKGAEKMSQWIEEYGESIEVVFSNNDEMALGAIESLKNSNIEVNPIVIGIDGIEEALIAIQNEELKGTIINDSKKQAELIFELSYRLSKQESLDSIEELERSKYIEVDHEAVTSENIDLYIK